MDEVAATGEPVEITKYGVPLARLVPWCEWRQNASSLGIGELPLTGEIGIRAAELDGLPGVPAHRMITADSRILGWTGQLSRHDARI